MDGEKWGGSEKRRHKSKLLVREEVDSSVRHWNERMPAEFYSGAFPVHPPGDPQYSDTAEEGWRMDPSRVF